MADDIDVASLLAGASPGNTLPNYRTPKALRDPYEVKQWQKIVGNIGDVLAAFGGRQPMFRQWAEGQKVKSAMTPQVTDDPMSVYNRLMGIGRADVADQFLTNQNERKKAELLVKKTEQQIQDEIDEKGIGMFNRVKDDNQRQALISLLEKSGKKFSFQMPQNMDEVNFLIGSSMDPYKQGRLDQYGRSLEQGGERINQGWKRIEQAGEFEKGRNERFYTGEAGKNSRFEKGEAGKAERFYAGEGGKNSRNTENNNTRRETAGLPPSSTAPAPKSGGKPRMIKVRQGGKVYTIPAP